MKIRITAIIITVVLIFLGSMFFMNKIKHKKEIEPIITKQEVILHQMLLDMFKEYSAYCDIQEISTTEKENSNPTSPLLITHYTVKIGDKTFSDDISIDWANQSLNTDDIFNDENKENFKNMQNYASQLSQEKTWDDLEGKMISMSIELIKSQLTYPNNADFGGANLEKVSDNEDGSGNYQVKGKVTAINVYGAKIKYNYIVSIKISKDLKQYEVIDLNIF